MRKIFFIAVLCLAFPVSACAQEGMDDAGVTVNGAYYGGNMSESEAERWAIEAAERRALEEEEAKKELAKRKRAHEMKMAEEQRLNDIERKKILKRQLEDGEVSEAHLKDRCVRQALAGVKGPMTASCQPGAACTYKGEGYKEYEALYASCLESYGLDQGSQ